MCWKDGKLSEEHFEVLIKSCEDEDKDEVNLNLPPWRNNLKTIKTHLLTNDAPR